MASATYDAANEQTTFNGATLTYDAKGFLESDGTNTYQWNARDQLVAISGAVTATFTYDALGRRTSKTINGQTATFVYDGDDMVAEVDPQAGPVAYLRGLAIDEPFVRQTSGGNEYYHADALGSTLALTDGTGNPTTTYTYDPFGQATVTGASTNAFQFTSRENDGIGLYYYRARYYSPTLHRFISEDPIGIEGGDENFYAYTFNSPTNYTDPTGEIVQFIIPAVVACARGAGSSLAADALSGRKPNFVDAALGCATGGANKAFNAAKAAANAGKGADSGKKIIDQLKGKGQLRNLRSNPNLKNANIEELLQKTPAELRDLTKQGEITQQTLKQIMKAFEGRNLGK